MKVRDIVKKLDDESYELQASVTITGPNGQVSLSPGTKLRPGVKILGMDIEEILELDIDKK